MMPLTVYGIANCDTVKKVCRFLTAHGHEFTFHDFRKNGLTQAQVRAWLEHVPMDKLLNKRGTTWRKLSQADKANADVAHLVTLMVNNPTLIKRPVIVHKGAVTVGFDKDVEANIGT